MSCPRNSYQGGLLFGQLLQKSGHESSFENQKEIAWAASLVLVLLVLALNLGGQALSRRAFHR